MPAREFLVIELGGLQTPLVGFTKDHPGCCIDALVVSRERKRLSCLFWLRDAPAGTLQEAKAQLDRVRRLQTLERDDEAGLWMGLFEMDAADLGDRKAQGLLGLLESYGMGEFWLRLEQGVTYARIPLPAGDRSVLATVKSVMAAQGMQAETDIEAGPPLGVWETLLLRARPHFGDLPAA